MIKKIKKILKPLYFFQYNVRHSFSFLIKCLYYKSSGDIVIKIRGGVTNCVLNSCDVINKGKNNTIIIGSQCRLSCLTFYFEGDNNTIYLQEGIGVNGGKNCRTRLNAVGGCKITIGAGSLLSNNIQFHTSDYHSILDENGKRTNMPEDIVIGKHVWIGLDCLFLKGSYVPDNCMVAARSVVNKKIEDEYQGSLIAGVTAKVVKNNIKWDKRNIL